jgi:5'(3')-deoxyribonucleotidase
MLIRENLIVPLRIDKRLPRILIDQDDVLAYCVKGIADMYNKLHGTNLTPEDCRAWDLTETFGPGIYDMLETPGLFRNLEPVKEGIEVFERLYMSGRYDIYIVTAAHPSAYAEKIEWVRKYLPFFPLKNFIACQSKDAVWGDILFDDGAHNIEAFDGIGEAIVLDRPHNRHLQGYKRLYSWYEFEEYINRKFYGEVNYKGEEAANY